LTDVREQLRKAEERETRLLALLETEQQSRRDLETKLLPAPKPAPVGKVRAWALVILLLVALAGLVVTLLRPELVGGLTGS
jgi:cytochrome c-type biogenesis protein CcmH/NrfG